MYATDIEQSTTGLRLVHFYLKSHDMMSLKRDFLICFQFNLLTYSYSNFVRPTRPVGLVLTKLVIRETGYRS